MLRRVVRYENTNRRRERPRARYVRYASRHALRVLSAPTVSLIASRACFSTMGTGPSHLRCSAESSPSPSPLARAVASPSPSSTAPSPSSTAPSPSSTAPSPSSTPPPSPAAPRSSSPRAVPAARTRAARRSTARRFGRRRGSGDGGSDAGPRASRGSPRGGRRRRRARRRAPKLRRGFAWGTGQSPPRAAHRTSATGGGACVTGDVFAARIVPGRVGLARAPSPRRGDETRRRPASLARARSPRGNARGGFRRLSRGCRDRGIREPRRTSRRRRSFRKAFGGSHFVERRETLPRVASSRSRRRTAATAAASASAPSESRAAAAWMNAYSNARDATRRTSSDRSPAATATRAYSRDRVVAKTPGSSVEMQKGWCAS